jgi:hypothetical protein
MLIMGKGAYGFMKIERELNAKLEKVNNKT